MVKNMKKKMKIKPNKIIFIISCLIHIEVCKSIWIFQINK